MEAVVKRTCIIPLEIPLAFHPSYSSFLPASLTLSFMCSFDIGSLQLPLTFLKVMHLIYKLANLQQPFLTVVEHPGCGLSGTK